MTEDLDQHHKMVDLTTFILLGGYRLKVPRVCHSTSNTKAFTSASGSATA
jgi:hypothetical protein